MRARDIRAIAFCIISTVSVAGGSYAVTENLVLVGALTAAWSAFILTRPRMIRVWRRLNGETLEMKSGYHWD